MTCINKSPLYNLIENFSRRRRSRRRRIAWVTVRIIVVTRGMRNAMPVEYHTTREQSILCHAKQLLYYNVRCEKC